MPRETIIAASEPAASAFVPFLGVLGLVDEVPLVVDEEELLEVVAFVVGEEEVSLEEVLDSVLVFSVELVVCEDETAVDEAVETPDDVELLGEVDVVPVEVVVSVVEVVTEVPVEPVLLGAVEVPFDVLGLLLTVVPPVESPLKIARRIERTKRVFICEGRGK